MLRGLRRVALISMAILGTTSLAGLGPAGTGRTKTSARKATNGCLACREKAPVLDPGQFKDPVVRTAYQVARQYPALIDQIHCFCECQEREGHKTLLTCFTSTHAQYCEVCIDSANLAGKMKHEGAPDIETVRVAETLKNNIPGHPPTEAQRQRAR